MHLEHFAKHPDKLKETIDALAEEYGDEVYDFFNCHIKNEDEYNKAVSYLKNFDKTNGAHWNLQTIKQKTNIDFHNEEYTLYDFAYAVNMKYSDEGDLMPVDSIFIAAQRYLEDDDFPGEPSERSYHDYKCRKKYFG